jgi:hypothetical protein
LAFLTELVVRSFAVAEVEREAVAVRAVMFDRRYAADNRAIDGDDAEMARVGKHEVARGLVERAAEPPAGIDRKGWAGAGQNLARGEARQPHGRLWLVTAASAAACSTTAGVEDHEDDCNDDRHYHQQNQPAGAAARRVKRSTERFGFAGGTARGWPAVRPLQRFSRGG